MDNIDLPHEYITSICPNPNGKGIKILQFRQPPEPEVSTILLNSKDRAVAFARALLDAALQLPDK
jgi:hypothetical protein